MWQSCDNHVTSLHSGQRWCVVWIVHYRLYGSSRNCDYVPHWSNVKLTNALSSVLSQWLQRTNSSMSLSRPAPSWSERSSHHPTDPSLSHTHTHTCTLTDRSISNGRYDLWTPLEEWSEAVDWKKRQLWWNKHTSKSNIFWSILANLQLQRRGTLGQREWDEASCPDHEAKSTNCPQTIARSKQNQINEWNIIKYVFNSSHTK